MVIVFATLVMKERTARKVKVAMINAISMVNVSKENVYVNLDGEGKIVIIKFVQMNVLAMEFAKIGDVFVSKDGKDLIVL